MMVMSSWCTCTTLYTLRMSTYIISDSLPNMVTPKDEPILPLSYLLFFSCIFPFQPITCNVLHMVYLITVTSCTNIPQLHLHIMHS